MSATAPGLEMNGVRPGAECWLVRRPDITPPLRCPAAVLVIVRGECHVLHDGQTYDWREVFATEAAARESALEWATWYRDHYRTQLERYTRVVLQLEGRI